MCVCQSRGLSSLMDDAEVQQWLRGHFNLMPSDGPVAKTHEVCGYTRGTSV